MLDLLLLRAKRLAPLALAVALLSGACAHRRAAPTTLYDDLGGRMGIDVLVMTLLDCMADDTRIVERFADSDIERFHSQLSDHLCQVAGGPCRYEGEDMRTVHGGMQITELEFNALVEDLQTAMHRLELPISTQNRLLALLAPMQRDIVYQ